MVEPVLRDSWFYTGLAYEKMERWQEALEADERAPTPAGAKGGSGEAARIIEWGMIYPWDLRAQKTKWLLAALERAIEKGAFRSTWETAEACCSRGLILS